jgi:hypothetical protein
MRHIFDATNGDVFVNVVSHNGQFIVQVIDCDTGEFIEIKRFPTIHEARQHAYRFIV